MPNSAARKLVTRSATWLMTLATFLLLSATSVFAQTFTVLYSFTGGTDGGKPYGGVALDNKGNVYGTTSQGGSASSVCPLGCGVVFKVDTADNETVLHSFGRTITDGAMPFFVDLLRDGAGSLFGATYQGGSKGYGTVFALNPKGKETVLSLPGGAAGGFPEAGVTSDAAGNLYGTAYYRGSGCPPYGCGTVFKITKSGRGKLLHSFSGPGGKNPVGSVAVDASGNVYGVTEFGGTDDTGAAYKLDPNGTETLLYSFLDEGDGGFPNSGPILDDAGNLYLATGGGGYGRSGTIFEIDHTGMPSVLYTFCPTGDCLDGAYPWGSLLHDSGGNLYGTTQQGGDFGAGVVFVLDTNGVLSVLHSFNISTDGGFPTGALARDSAGNFYGTTIDGGAHRFGTVYKLTPN